MRRFAYTYFNLKTIPHSSVLLSQENIKQSISQ